MTTAEMIRDLCAWNILGEEQHSEEIQSILSWLALSRGGHGPINEQAAELIAVGAAVQWLGINAMCHSCERKLVGGKWRIYVEHLAIGVHETDWCDSALSAYHAAIKAVVEGGGG